MKVYVAYFKLFNACGDLYCSKIIGVFRYLSSAKQAATDTVGSRYDLEFIEGVSTWYSSYVCGNGNGDKYRIGISEQEIQV